MTIGTLPSGKRSEIHLRRTPAGTPRRKLAPEIRGASGGTRQRGKRDQLLDTTFAVLSADMSIAGRPLPIVPRSDNSRTGNTLIQIRERSEWSKEDRSATIVAKAAAGLGREARRRVL
jgi:hypothetical protein